jgi:hypothetical protein
MGCMRPRSLWQRPVKQAVSDDYYFVIRRKWIKPSHDFVTSPQICCSKKNDRRFGGLLGVILSG